MNEFMRERLLRRLETLSDERLYQVLDYVEFLESKYAERKPAPPNVFQRFGERAPARGEGSGGRGQHPDAVSCAPRADGGPLPPAPLICSWPLPYYIPPW